MTQKMIVLMLVLVTLGCASGCRCSENFTTVELKTSDVVKILRVPGRGMNIVLQINDNEYLAVKRDCCLENLGYKPADLTMCVMPPDKLEISKQCSKSRLIGKNIFDVLVLIDKPRYCFGYDNRCDGRAFTIPQHVDARKVNFSFLEFAVAKFIFGDGLAVYVDSDGTIVWVRGEKYHLGQGWR